jgi:hypothetical protein
MNFHEIVKIEPRLNDLKVTAQICALSTALSTHEKDRFWYRVLKPQMLRLVGFAASEPALQNTAAYDSAYREFIRILEL